MSMLSKCSRMNSVNNLGFAFVSRGFVNIPGQTLIERWPTIILIILYVHLPALFDSRCRCNTIVLAALYLQMHTGAQCIAASIRPFRPRCVALFAMLCLTKIYKCIILQTYVSRLSSTYVIRRRVFHSGVFHPCGLNPHFYSLFFSTSAF